MRVLLLLDLPESKPPESKLFRKPETDQRVDDALNNAKQKTMNADQAPLQNQLCLYHDR